MLKLLLGCTSILSSVIILCTGFIISALKSVQESSNENSGAFNYGIFDINFLWFIIPLILLIIGFTFLYSYSKNNKVPQH